MLALPQGLAKLLCAKGQCLPHAFRTVVLEYIASEQTGVGVEKYKLGLDWCLLAAQHDAGGGSVVSQTVEVPLSKDEGFHTWCDQKVVTTLGPRPRMRGGGG